MNTPVGYRNGCNIFKVVFTFFYPSILFLNGITMEMQLHLSAFAPYIEYIKIRGG